MMRRTNKKTINVLLNVDNFFGDHSGRVAPLLLFIVVAALPFLVYTILFMAIIPLKYMLIAEALWAGRMALFILGNENERLKKFRNRRNDQFLSVYRIVKVAHVHEDGLIEYTYGKVAYILTGFVKSYSTDEAFEKDFTDFLEALEGWVYDISLFNVVRELELKSTISNLNIYSDDDLKRERLEFYAEQDRYSEDRTKLYQYVITIKSTKDNWKILRESVNEVIQSYASRVFKEIHVCSKDEVTDIISRELCAYLDINKMLREKYKNEEFYGSRILFYGDEVPDKYRKKTDTSSYVSGRVEID